MRTRKEQQDDRRRRRRRRGRINRRESDSGQPNASRHCPRLFAPLISPLAPRWLGGYGVALFAYALNIAARFEGSQHHILTSPLHLGKKRQRQRAREKEENEEQEQEEEE